MADRTYHRDNTWISIDPAVWLRLEEKLAVQLGDLLGLRLIPTVIDQNPCAHLRRPIDMIFHGRSCSVRQA